MAVDETAADADLRDGSVEVEPSQFSRHVPVDLRPLRGSRHAVQPAGTDAHARLIAPHARHLHDVEDDVDAVGVGAAQGDALGPVLSTVISRGRNPRSEKSAASISSINTRGLDGKCIFRQKVKIEFLPALCCHVVDSSTLKVL